MPATITLSNATATRTASVANGLWEATMPVTSGSNSIALSATETNFTPGTNPQTTTGTIQVNVTAEPARSFTYDANGAMIDNGAGQTYEWDAAQRLVAINYAGGARSEFSYDGLGRRTKIVEKNGSGTVTSTKMFVWDGMEIAEERDGNNAVTKRFYPHGMQTLNSQQQTLNFYYTRDHLGSLRELTDSTGALRGRWIYDPYGVRSANRFSLITEPARR